MAISKMKYIENKGFWISESFMQLVMHYIYQELINPQYSLTLKQELINDLDDNINGLCNGYIGLNWEDSIVSQLDKQTMIQVLQNVKTTLQNKGAFISVEEMQAIPTEDRMFKWLYSEKPFPTDDLIKIIDALIQMLQGTWQSTNYNMDAEINWKYED